MSDASLINDDDRLTMLEAFEGASSVKVQHERGPFSALFRREAVVTSLGPGVDQNTAALVCLESTARRLELARDDRLAVEGEGDFKIKRRADRDVDLGPGFTRLYLKR